MTEQWTTEELRELRRLLAQVMSVSELEVFAHDHLDEALDALVGGGTQVGRVNGLVQACVRRGSVDKLVDGLAADRPDHPEVVAFCARARARSRDPAHVGGEPGPRALQQTAR